MILQAGSGGAASSITGKQKYKLIPHTHLQAQVILKKVQDNKIQVYRKGHACADIRVLNKL